MTMRLMQTVVGTETFQDVAHNDSRLRLLRRVAAVAEKKRCDLIQLPAGFLTVASEPRVDEAIRTLTRLASEHGLAVAGGVDLVAMLKYVNGKQNGTLPRDGLPAFGFCAGYGAKAVRKWKQQSARAVHSKHARDIDLTARTTRVAGRRVLHLVCGEMHNAKYREKMAADRDGWDVVLVSGHAGLGQGLVPTIAHIARRLRVPVVHVQHTTSAGSMHMALRSGRSDPRYCDRNVIEDSSGEWIGWTVRNV